MDEFVGLLRVPRQKVVPMVTLNVILAKYAVEAKEAKRRASLVCNRPRPPRPLTAPPLPSPDGVLLLDEEQAWWRRRALNPATVHCPPYHNPNTLSST
jgi:hypothetical protein